MKIYGVGFTDAFANTAFLLFEINAAVIDVCDQGYGLRKIDMNGFVLRNIPIELIRVFNRAIFCTGRAARAFVLYNVPGPFGQGYLKIPFLAFYVVNFCMGEYLYVRMPADLDQFG